MCNRGACQAFPFFIIIAVVLEFVKRREEENFLLDMMREYVIFFALLPRWSGTEAGAGEIYLRGGGAYKLFKLLEVARQ